MDGELEDQPRLDKITLMRTLGQEFGAAGHRLYLVGGSVRDQILGRSTQDLDFTTDALPDVTRSLLAGPGPTSMYLVGEKFGTIGAIFGDVKVEITTFRGEQYQPATNRSIAAPRHPEVHSIADHHPLPYIATLTFSPPRMTCHAY